MDAYTKPQYKKDQIIQNKNTLSEHSTVCVDDIQMNLVFENNVLKNVEYKAKGCAIFLASVELFIKQALYKTKVEINSILDDYFEMINTNQIDEQKASNLDKLIVFKNVKVHLNRLECASIIYRIFKKAINE
ncbi:iron-sulfur cluster assembly scaffold protein [[Mycoplasma] anseris]|nr:iron-sulfur cluster assembly scaffold protein [[Mycoplasma] anseris]